MEEPPFLHLLMYPFLAYGHISPFLQLARKISAVDPSIRITILTSPANVQRVTSLLPSLPSVRVHPLPLPSIPGLPAGAESTFNLSPSTAELLKLAVDRTKPQVASLLASLRPHFVLHDFAQPWLPSIATPLGIKTLFFSVFAAASTAFLTVPNRKPTNLSDPPPGFPAGSSLAAGVPAYQAADFEYIFKKFGDGDGPTVYDRVVACMSSSTAVVAKTCMEMEGPYITYVESQYKKPVLLAGPVVPEKQPGELDRGLAEWLDRFEEDSVVFSSFGSETFLTDDMAKELVEELELTGMPFLVVLNSPDSGEKKVTGASSKGLVHRGWVQQQLIVGHRSVGCFVCHGGFSSVVEGVVAGCKVVMLPQRGDQFLNARLFAGDLGVGVEVEREEETGRFDRSGVCKAVKAAMEGGRVEEGHGRWREFLVDRERQERFTAELVGKLKELARGDINA